MINFRFTLSLFLLVILAASQVYSQKAPEINTAKCFGGNNADYGQCLISTLDDGYAFVAYTQSDDRDVVGLHGGSDIWLVKLNAMGIIEWQKCYGGSDEDRAYSLISTKDGGYVIAGYTISNNGDVSGNHGVGTLDAWIIKLDNKGGIEWQKCMGGKQDDEAYSIIENTNGGYTFIGSTRSIDGDVSGKHGDHDLWVVELTASGNLHWQKCYGGDAVDYGLSLIQTTDGGYMLCGTTTSTEGDISGNHGGIDRWIVKIGSWGTLEWQKCLGGSNDDYGVSVAATDDGGYITCGGAFSQDGDVMGNHSNSGDAWVVKVTSSGQIQWQKNLGGKGEELALSIIKAVDGGFVIVGVTGSNDGDVVGSKGLDDAWIIKLDTSGMIRWQQCIGGSDVDLFYSIVQSPNGIMAALGESYSTDGDIKTKHIGVDVLFVILQSESGIIEQSSATRAFSLTAYPNPATKNLSLGYDLPKAAADVVISISDITGREIQKLHADVQSEGHNEMTLDLSRYAEGTYYITVSVGDLSETKSVEIVK